MEPTKEKKSAFERPLECGDVEWVMVKGTRKNGRMQVAPYVSGRTVINLLNEEFGIYGWQDRYTPMPQSGASVRVEKGQDRSGDVYEQVPGGVFCHLSVKDPSTGEWIERGDGAPDDGFAPVKMPITNALKRAAKKFGLGAELDNFPRVLITTEDRWIPDWAEEQLCEVVNQFNKGVRRMVVYIDPPKAAAAPTPQANGAPKAVLTTNKTPEQLIALLLSEAKGWSIEAMKEKGKEYFERRGQGYLLDEAAMVKLNDGLNLIYKEKVAKLKPVAQ